MIRKKTKVLSVTSGKGGVGKTSILANLAYCLAKKGNRVLILDGDMGMANVDIMFGKQAPKNLLDLLRNDCSIEDVLFRLRQNLYLISSGSALPQMTNLSPFEKKSILDQVMDLEGIFDYLLIDTAPGIDESVRYLNSTAGEVLVVVTPEPASLTDSYALIKILHQYQNTKEFSILCNQAKDERDAQNLFSRLQNVCDQFLNIRLKYFGAIPRDTLFLQAIRRQELVAESYPSSESAVHLEQLSRKLTGVAEIADLKSSIQAFVQSPEVGLYAE